MSERNSPAKKSGALSKNLQQENRRTSTEGGKLAHTQLRTLRKNSEGASSTQMNVEAFQQVI